MNRARIAGGLLLLAFGCWTNDVLTAETQNAPPTAALSDNTHATPSPEKPAVVAISGYGFWGNRELKKLLDLLQAGDKPPVAFDADFVEDAAVIILSKLERDGFLQPRLKLHLEFSDGTKSKYEWAGGAETILPRPLSIKRAHFIIHRGVLFYYRHLDMTGLASLDAKQARAYFIEAGSLIPLKTMRIYTPSRLKRRTSNLAEVLARLGYQDAKVELVDLQRDDPSGAVTVQIAVTEGLKRVVRSVQVEIYGPDDTAPRTLRIDKPNVPDSRFWQQDFVQSLQAEQYREGFADATAALTIIGEETEAAVVWVDRLAKVQTGPRITVGEVTFIGAKHSRRSLLRHKVRVRAGKELNRIEVERGRHRLSRLGIFDSVTVRYEDVSPDVRNVIYELVEGKRLDISLVLGYGSYELVRGGLLIEQNNIFGLAHTARLRAMQSFKSTSVDYLYTMPELIGEDISVFFDASLLRRQELTFNREEYGGSAGVQRHLHAIDTDASLRYSYQFLTALDVSPTTQTQSVTKAQVASIVLDLKHDQRDNPLLPREGYSVFSVMEVASMVLGGEVDFQRLELGASFHHKLIDTLIVHLGLRHGIGVTLASQREDLPFNKRFFPGGENSVRGYQQGEAVPRDANGESLGAETYLQGNIELEQVLTPAWSLVLFADAVGIAADMNDYPFDETLYSVGGGIRWKTVVGPVRLEYGFNPNPRPKDPAGTLHFSVGFPF